MKIGHSFETGQPIKEGVYVVEIHFGWKLLEWKDGAWWHPALVGRWPANDPLQWVGPLPPLAKGKPETEFDL